MQFKQAGVILPKPGMSFLAGCIGQRSGGIAERGFDTIQNFGDAMQQMFNRATARQVQLDAILVLNDTHGEFEQFDDHR